MRNYNGIVIRNIFPIIILEGSITVSLIFYLFNWSSVLTIFKWMSLFTLARNPLMSPSDSLLSWKVEIVVFRSDWQQLTSCFIISMSNTYVKSEFKLLQLSIYLVNSSSFSLISKFLILWTITHNHFLMLMMKVFEVLASFLIIIWFWIKETLL